MIVILLGMIMKREEIEKIANLYKMYGFEVAEQDEYCIVFTFSNGYFFNCEIMVEEHEKEKEYKKKYEEIGYSTRIVYYCAFEEVKNKLFKGFFNIEFNKKRRITEYDKFVENQNKKIYGEQNKYSYVVGKYLLGNDSYEGNIVDSIYGVLQNDGAQLVLVEAAAGFGKTCTSYEVLKKLASDISDTVPVFIELSKNRNAKVFRHVLLDAIDKNFSHLSSEVVRYEIKNGRVPLIIDGFDELLSKSVNEKESGGINLEDSSDAQNMLATIAELFRDDSNAKIMLTSRKSSLFIGEEFEEWAIENLKNCEVTRFMLEEPTLKNWLGMEKVNYIKKMNIPFYTISNPIILSIYRNMGFDEFVQKCQNTESVLQEYFQSIMSREKTRQSLLLEETEQYQIFTQLASVFVDFGISADESKFIKDIFEMIISESELAVYLHRYDALEFIDERPNEDEFIRKLVQHALLDRKSQDAQIIGFVNDFVFGVFVGEAILNQKLDIKKIDKRYIELAATSFAVRSEKTKRSLYGKLTEILEKLDACEKLLIDMKLCGKTVGTYMDGYISSISFQNAFIFDKNSKFINICFNQCFFYEVDLQECEMTGCQFIDCKFYNCVFPSANQCDDNISFIACEGVEKRKIVEERKETEENKYERIVLEQYWRPGRANADPRHTYRTLLKGIETSKYVFVDEAISSLKDKNILFVKGSYLVLDFKKMNEIREILGR